MTLKILLTGANGYIGLRLLPELLAQGHTVVAVVRDRRRFPIEDFADAGDRLQLVEGDFLKPESFPRLPDDLDVAYYLLHSLGGGSGFSKREETLAHTFVDAIAGTACGRVIYLSGLGDEGEALSDHLGSRHRTADVLRESPVPLTVLRASIIVGSGSASFEIIRDLTEKLPVMIAPKWLTTRCQPIAIRNVLEYMAGVLEVPETAGRTFDIGGPDVHTYRELLEGFARVRGLRRWFIPVPVLTPRLSSYWLLLMTSTNYQIARALVDSLIHETVCLENTIRELIPTELLSYEEAVEKAFARIAQNRVPSKWIDSLASGSFDPQHFNLVRVPEHGVLRDERLAPLLAPRETVIERVWSMGGGNGWPVMNWAWRLRGMLDKLVGGTGLRRGRRHPSELRSGDALDFWRVLLADRDKGRLILHAEMKLPGDAWLEFALEPDGDGGERLRQTATLRPQGLLGRLYWFAVTPFHWMLFPRMARKLAAP